MNTPLSDALAVWRQAERMEAVAIAAPHFRSADRSQLHEISLQMRDMYRRLQRTSSLSDATLCATRATIAAARSSLDAIARRR